jgi:Ca2+-binding RTX toxin-like protein
MRSHLAPRLLMLLMIALLVGALAAPAEGKRPRRYDVTVLEDWVICPTGATLTIGHTGDPTATPDPNPDTTTWPLVDLDAELPSSPGASIIEGGRRTGLRLTDVPNQEIVVNQLDDDAGRVVTDDPPLGQDGQPIEGSAAVITHREVVEVRWSQPLEIRDQLRLGLSESGIGLTYGLFETVFCPSSDGGGPGDSSPGVTTPGPSLSTEEILDLSTRIDENSEVGRGPDGSLIPRSQCTIVGKPGDDRIVGTPGNDVICGLGGNDVVDGAGGIDLIDGADGNDRLRGGSDKDLLFGLRGDDRLNGNSGNDQASGGAGIDRVRGSSGNDPLLSGGSGTDRLSGGKGRDRIRGGSGDDRIMARDRTRDTIDGGNGRDRATVDLLRSTGVAPRQADRVRRVEQLL